MEPLESKYSLTHSDETGERFLFIGRSFAEDAYCELRDEVNAEWHIDEETSLHAFCVLDCSASKYSPKQRYEIFSRHLNRALAAILYGDRDSVQDMVDCKVYVHFQSSDKTQDLIEEHGLVGDYLEAVDKQ